MAQVKGKIVIISRVLVVVMLVSMVAFGGYLFTVNNEGQSRQQALQNEYNSLKSSIGRCIQDNFRETSFSDASIEVYHGVLVVVAMTEFVDADGNAIERTPEVVLPEVIDAMSVWGNFTLDEVTGLSGLVIMCGGTYSPIYDSAVEFQRWVDEGELWDRMVRERFPTRDLNVNDLATYSDSHAVGSEALDWLTRTVNPYTGSSLEVGLEDD